MRLFALILLFLALVGLLTAPHSQPVSLAQDETPAELTQQIIELTNAERAAAGVPPLKHNAALSAAAAWMAEDIAQNDPLYLGAPDSLGRNAAERVADFGYTNLRALAEHYAIGQKDAQEVFDTWMENDARRAAMLDPEYREIGVGFFMDDTSTESLGSYWVQDLGSRSGEYPVIINNEADATADPDVALYIYGTNWATEMRLSQDGTTWTTWDTYQAERAWRLEPGPAGQRTVFVELRGPEQTYTVSDSIRLTEDAAPPATATATPTATPTPPPTSTPTPPPTATATPTATPTPEPSPSPTPPPTDTPSPTATRTTSPVATATRMPSPTPTTNPRVGQNANMLYLPFISRSAPPEPVFVPTPTPTQEPAPQPVGTCLSADEYRLAQLINDHRVANGLPPVPLSKSLTQVGQAHARDLHIHQPHTQPGCNLHSWSAAGTWNPVCYTADHANAAGMWNKPREVTGGLYDAYGYENAYSTNGQINPDAAYELWIGHAAHNDLILERSVWAGRAWPAMGVGIYEGYAVLWFGDAADPQGTVSRCP
jgi:uncharacterized protein YkwD